MSADAFQEFTDAIGRLARSEVERCEKEVQREMVINRRNTVEVTLLGRRTVFTAPTWREHPGKRLRIEWLRLKFRWRS